MGKASSKQKKSDFFSFLKFREGSSAPYHLFEIQGQTKDENELKRHMLDILDGKYSMTLSDHIILEEKLIP